MHPQHRIPSSPRQRKRKIPLPSFGMTSTNNTDASEQQNKQQPSSTHGKQSRQNRQVAAKPGHAINETSQEGTAAATTSTTTDTTTDNDSSQRGRKTKRTKINLTRNPQFRLYFVEKGRDMHADILKGPKQNAVDRGAVVLTKFVHEEDEHGDDSQQQQLPPTHIVVGNNVSSAAVVSRACGFATVQDMRHWLYRHDAICVTKAWAAKVVSRKQPYAAPQRFAHPAEIYREIMPLAPSSNRASVSLFGAATTSVKSTTTTSSSTRATTAVEQQRRNNEALASIFVQLFKAYQEAPLDPIDTWRAYTFSTVASRLRALDFDVTRATLARVRAIKGFGSSCVEIMEEFVNLQEMAQDDDDDDDDEGTRGDYNYNTHKKDLPLCVTRLRNVQNDPQRQALRSMMKIWGVGRAKALEMIKAGYTSVEQLVQEFEKNALKVTLQRNQYIGLTCYNDFLDKMDRLEVEQIAGIITQTIRDLLPGTQVEIMGSYRRGAQSLGDIDLLMTHPDYVSKVPPKALGRLVDVLRAQGHMSHHLTLIAGMDPTKFESLSPDIVKRLGTGDSSSRPRARDKELSSMYMGVFGSPIVPGRQRRVDVKFYPYRNRIFASIYFTGNGWFNRSSRLWARRKFGCTLSDHGLVRDDTGVRVMEALSERQVFDRLQLVWKEPMERDGFDDVVGIDSKRATDLAGWSQAEFHHEESHHGWIE